ncbi:MAG: hypothetical protein ACJ762_10455 [Solirubrobacteraceae bacterium]
MRHFARGLLLAAAFTSTAQAAPAPVFALKPIGHSSLGYFRFAGAPGQPISGSVRVVNAGTVAGTAELAAVDGTTGATTGAVYRTVGEASSDVGAWLALDTREVTLAPGASAVVGFTVAVPADARRGQHLGGIVARPVVAAKPAEASDAKRSFRVDIVDQSILAVQVDLPGAARSLLAVRDVRAGGNPGYQTLDITMSNPGEKMVKGSGQAIVTTASGEVVARQRFAIDTFLPRTRIVYPLVLRGEALLPGDYHTTVDLKWDGGGSSSTELPFSVSRGDIEQAYGAEGVAKLPSSGGHDDTPLALFAGVGLALILLGFGAMAVWFRRRTRELERRLGTAVAVPEPDAEPTVTDARREPAGRT